MNKVTQFILIFSLLFSSIAIAQDKLNFSGQVRPRFEYSNRTFDSNTGANTYTFLRTILSAEFTPSKTFSGFIQIQDSRRFGDEPTTLSDTKNIDLHQAYFKLGRLFGSPIDWRAGRMEVNYGDQRIVGAVGWHNVGRSFDGSMFTFINKSQQYDLFVYRIAESTLPGDSLDAFFTGIYTQFKVAGVHSIQPFVMWDTKIATDNSRFTLGAYLKGSFGNFNYKSDLAYQTGSTLKDSTKLDVGSYMVTADLGYTFKAKTKPKLVAGAAYLSGDDNSTDDKYGVFNTLFATNHKFYGYMDYFLNIPLNTYDKGLIDIYGKFGLWAAKKLWLNLDYHLFNSAADYTLISGETSNSFGSEIDFTLLYKYTKKLSFVLGLSTFSPGDIFKEKRGEDSSTWGYLMVIANFN